MSSNYLVFPRLMRSEAVKRVKQIKVSALNELEERYKQIELTRYMYSPIGGNRISEKEIHQLREDIQRIANDLGYPQAPSQRNRVLFDKKVARYLYENLQISLNEGTKQEIWNFICCDLLPNIVMWRYFIAADSEPTDSSLIDRFLGARRNCFKRHWLRAKTFAKLFDGEDDLSYLDAVESSDLEEFDERTTITGNLFLARSLLLNFWTVCKNKNNSQNFVNRLLLRDVVKQCLRLTPWLRFEALKDDELKISIESLFDKSLKNLGYEATDWKNNMTSMIQGQLSRKYQQLQCYSIISLKI